MARAEEIRAASKVFLKAYFQNDIHAFVEGAKWADQSTIEKVKELIKINTDSTGNKDDYFTGMTNGMICILSCLTEKEPDYIDCPKTK